MKKVNCIRRHLDAILKELSEECDKIPLHTIGVLIYVLFCFEWIEDIHTYFIIIILEFC